MKAIGLRPDEGINTPRARIRLMSQGAPARPNRGAPACPCALRSRQPPARSAAALRGCFFALLGWGLAGWPAMPLAVGCVGSLARVASLPQKQRGWMLPGTRASRRGAAVSCSRRHAGQPVLVGDLAPPRSRAESRQPGRCCCNLEHQNPEIGNRDSRAKHSLLSSRCPSSVCFFPLLLPPSPVLANSQPFVRTVVGLLAERMIAGPAVALVALPQLYRRR